MTSHELARLLLEAPDLPVLLSVYNHEYSSLNDAGSHGHLVIGRGPNNYGHDHIWLGTIEKSDVTEVLHDPTAEEYERLCREDGA